MLHLMVEEAAPRPREPVERLDRALRLAMGRTEGGEIVPPDQRLRRAVHGPGIERRATCQALPRSSVSGARRLTMR
jgi:hypothetical protein